MVEAPSQTCPVVIPARRRNLLSRATNRNSSSILSSQCIVEVSHGAQAQGAEIAGGLTVLTKRYLPMVGSYLCEVLVSSMFLEMVGSTMRHEGCTYSDVHWLRTSRNVIDDLPAFKPG